MEQVAVEKLFRRVILSGHYIRPSLPERLGVDRYQFQTCHSLCGRWAPPKTYID